MGKNPKDPQIKQHYNFLKKKLTKEIKQENEQNWEAFCDDMKLMAKTTPGKNQIRNSEYSYIFFHYLFLNFHLVFCYYDCQ